MGRYLIDSNVISNVITRIEALSWRSPITQDEFYVKSFVNSSNIISLSDIIVDKCIEIRRTCKIKTPDAIIAATAIVHDFTLLTSDYDFKRIPNLKIINPNDL